MNFHPFLLIVILFSTLFIHLLIFQLDFILEFIEDTSWTIFYLAVGMIHNRQTCLFSYPTFLIKHLFSLFHDMQKSNLAKLSLCPASIVHYSLLLCVYRKEIEIYLQCQLLDVIIFYLHY